MPSANRSRLNRQRRQAPPGEVAPPPVEPGMDTPPPGIETIGDILRHRRQQRGDDLQQIADYLCIRRSFLVALENSEYDQLPADAYVIGFLRSYAVYLGFDGADAINRYRGEMAGRRRKPALILPTPIAEGRTPSPAIMIAAGIVAILIYALWYGLSNADRTAANVPPPLPSVAAPPPAPSAPPVNAAANTPSPPAPNVSGGIALPAPPPAPTLVQTTSSSSAPIVADSIAAPASAAPAVVSDAASTPAQATLNAHLVIRAEKETWVVVADGKGHSLLDRVMKPGETWPVPDTEGLKLTTGNSGGIVLVLDGKDLPKLSRDSRILHDIPLDAGKLKAQAAAPH